MSFQEDIFNNFIRLNRGFDLPDANLVEGIYPVVASTSIKAYHKESRVKGPGVVTGRSGSLGTVQYVPGDYWPLNTALYVKDFKGNFPKFVFYFLQQMHLESFNSGAGVPTLNQNHLHKLKIQIPKLTFQRKIATILSAYDELIENNQRRIALLEKMAEEIYREWFVRLRFPGHEKVKFVKGMPDGWQPVPSNKVFNVLSGGTPNTDNPLYWDGDIPFFTPRDAGENYYILKTEENLTPKGLDSCNSRLYKKDTIFITARGTVGKIGLAYRDMAMNQSCYALTPREEGAVYFYFLSMKNAITYIKGVSKSGVFDNIIVDTFKVVPFFLPPQPLIAQFNEITTPIFRQLGMLLEANEQLVKMRDALLPRLISGKLSVENLGIQFPPSMAEEMKTEPAAHA